MTAEIVSILLRDIGPTHIKNEPERACKFENLNKLKLF